MKQTSKEQLKILSEIPDRSPMFYFNITLGIILLLISLIGLAFSVHATSFPSNINISTSYDGTTCNANISTEQNTHSYNCYQNSTNSFTFSLERTTDTTITYQNNNTCDLSDLYSISANVNQIATFCNSIQASYSDFKTCLSDYAKCSIENLMLKKADTNRSIVENQSIAYKSQLDSLKVSDGILQSNLSSCQKDLKKNKSDYNLVYYMLIGVSMVLFVCLVLLLYPTKSEQKKELPKE